MDVSNRMLDNAMDKTQQLNIAKMQLNITKMHS